MFQHIAMPLQEVQLLSKAFARHGEAAAAHGLLHGSMTSAFMKTGDIPIQELCVPCNTGCQRSKAPVSKGLHHA